MIAGGALGVQSPKRVRQRKGLALEDRIGTEWVAPLHRLGGAAGAGIPGGARRTWAVDT